ncbi:hypothetical protein HAX54_050677 [Datura stramonium]|uniref:Uncharacterized protein n=1 Tax=Datura stramonium TaxID=4076 RepID=A0ABS8RR08_DATST|nr:hypothetical protein [Datura stramonium]
MTKFNSFSKKIKKEAKRLVGVLKQMDQETERSFVPKDADQDTVDMIKTLKEANAMRISMFQMFLSFLSVPLLKPKLSKWSLNRGVVKNKGRLACEGGEEKDGFRAELEPFEAHLDNFENGLEGIYRCMSRSRSSLLNILKELGFSTPMWFNLELSKEKKETTVEKLFGDWFGGWLSTDDPRLIPRNIFQSRLPAQQSAVSVVATTQRWKVCAKAGV